METSVTQRGQTVIPAAIRRRHNIKGGSRLVWLDDGQTIRVVPVPEEPVAALRGRARGSGIGAQLLAERRADREREDP